MWSLVKFKFTLKVIDFPTPDGTDTNLLQHGEIEWKFGNDVFVFIPHIKEVTKDIKGL